MSKLYPLKFIPISSKRPWGGSYLAKELGKDFPENEKIGESWELADMGEQESVVENGEFKGKTIGELMESNSKAILGEELQKRFGKRFPLLVKYLDIEDKLSVQVHPNDETGKSRYDSLGKTEVWYVLDAKPQASVYMGFKSATDPQEFHDACKEGTAQNLMNVIHPAKGDVIFIKPGTVHAADGGIAICEIQESSDLTFRLYDWGRENNPATARKMHLDEAMDLINFNEFDPLAYTKSARGQIASCECFTVNRLEIEGIQKERTNGKFRIYNCLEGKVKISCSEGFCELNKGETALVPADCSEFELAATGAKTVLLESSI